MYTIDTKLDDGLPATGAIRDIYSGGSCRSGSNYNVGGALSHTNMGCTLAIGW